MEAGGVELEVVFEDSRDLLAGHATREVLNDDCAEIETWYEIESLEPRPKCDKV